MRISTATCFYSTRLFGTAPSIFPFEDGYITGLCKIQTTDVLTYGWCSAENAGAVKSENWVF
jgi:hypothetical protein